MIYEEELDNAASFRCTGFISNRHPITATPKQMPVL